MSTPLPSEALEQLFRDGRSLHTFTDRPVTDQTLRELYELLRLGPTGFNSQPARHVFVRSAEAKAKLGPALSSSNRAKTLAAPVTAIVAYDARFFDHLPALFPSYDARPLFEASVALTQQTAERNASLQAAYLILAARALGLDAGPMSGFNADAVDREFFPDGQAHALYLVNLGYGERSQLRPRLPRLSFEAAAKIV
ncbi:malonic semialdehyde reductase [Steroidobacter sp.]|uniref:malonic semialdehyde reductase n=1 Tax=Steroidobacter sp. TaxID=1978227 RepID=UPI001A3808C1|nr:malonic semialdehyde reductase [Steroidobacter sp.]MBL8267097.1 malonic semialdehyde reductase [Steroidobacter sp.]